MNINVLSILRNLVDIFIVWAIFYYILKNIKNNVKLALIFKGVIFILILGIISKIFNLVTVRVLLQYIVDWGFLALVIIFQPEIRTNLRLDLSWNNLVEVNY